jgi:dCTP deaminase
MGFLNSKSIEDSWPTLVLEGGTQSRIRNCSYELALGQEVFITNEDTKRQLQPGEQVSIPPGQMALLITEEVVCVPSNLIGFISIKFKHKSRGLVNVSGFHVDPGFTGRLIFSVYNASPRPLLLTRGSAVFIIWFCSLDAETAKPYSGEHQDQLSIPDEMVANLHGLISSPASLQKQLDDLNTDFARTKWLAAFIGVTLGALFSGIMVPVAAWALRATREGQLEMSHLVLAIILGFVLSTMVILLFRQLSSAIRVPDASSGRVTEWLSAIIKGDSEWPKSSRRQQQISRGAQRRKRS